MANFQIFEKTFLSNPTSGATFIISQEGTNTLYKTSISQLSGLYYGVSNPSNYTNQTSFNLLSGNLTTTGQTLLALINASSAGVSSINAQSGIMTLTGAGNLQVIVNGQNLTVSGVDLATATSLTNSGVSLYSQIIGLSGVLTNNYVLINSFNSLSGNLTATGVTLINNINTLTTNLTSTGQVLNGRIISLSGDLYSTGSNLQTQINANSGNLVNSVVSINNSLNTLTNNLASTGSTLDTKINSLSGNVINTYATITSLSNYGVKNINNLSGNLTLSGINNIGISASGNTLFVSGQDLATATNLGLTGSVLNNRIISLSGDLAATGTTLYALIQASSAGVSSLSVTGSNPFSGAVNITGAGGTQVILSGSNTIIVSGIQGSAGGSAGVNTLNGISGALTLSGAGNITIQNSGASTIFISGDVSTLATTSNLQTTGSILNNRIISLSGDLQTTGSNLQSRYLALSGNVVSTGQILNARIISLSGDLASTGTILNNKIDSIIQTGATVLNGQLLIGTSGLNAFEQGNLYGVSGIYIISGSGSLGVSIDTNTLATASNLTITGSTLNNRIISLSGDLASTGTTLNNRINTVNNLPKVTGFSVTGSTSQTGLLNFSGIGGTFLLLSGNNTLLISGAAGGQGAQGGSAGVNTINGISGGLFVSGVLPLMVTVSGNSNIWVSGLGLITTGNFETGSNILNGQLLIGASGTNSFDQGNLYGISGISIISGSGSLGVSATLLTNNLTQTGATLLSLINSSNAGVQHLNSLSGDMTISGAGGFITVVSSGSNTLFVSGNSSNFVTAADLTSTGSTLNNRIISLSGDLFITGSNLDNKINSLSGYSNNTFATITSLNNYGVKSVNNISGILNLSGAGNVVIQNSGSSTIFISGDTSTFLTSATLEQTGTLLNNRIISLSGDLFSTGNILNTRIVNWGVKSLNNISGDLVISGVSPVIVTASGTNRIWISGDIATATNLTSTGVTLIGLTNTLTSNLASTGSTLNTRIANLSGAFNQTGLVLNNRIISLSGDLYSTGDILNTRISNLSGAFNNTGANLFNLINQTGNLLYPLAQNPSGYVMTGNASPPFIQSGSAANAIVTGYTWNIDNTKVVNNFELLPTGNITNLGLFINNVYNGALGVLTIQKGIGYTGAGSIYLPSTSIIQSGGTTYPNPSNGILQLPSGSGSWHVLSFVKNSTNYLWSWGTNFA